MALRFDNISSLSIQRQSRFLQAGFNFSNTKLMRFNGYVLDLANSFGVSGIWTGIKTIENNAVDYQSLTVNGVDFGSGRIKSMDFADGNDVRYKIYTAEIEVMDSGDLTNLAGTYYSGISTQNFQYLDTFNEDFSFSKKLNGGYNYNHAATIRFWTGAATIDRISAAQALAKTLFTGGNLGFKFYSGYTNKQGKRYFNESYNVIDKTCTFRESFDFDSDQGNYSVYRTNTANLDEQGVVTSRESATIRGIENPNYQKAMSALNLEITGSYLRCSGTASYYVPTGDIIINSPIGQSRTLDIFNNVLTYDITYSSKPDNFGTYVWDYTQVATRVNGIADIQERGTIVGKGGTPAYSFALAQQGLQTIRLGMPSRISALFLTTFGTTSFLRSKSEDYAPIRGTISYSYDYSDDKALISNNGIRKKDIKTVVNESVYEYNKLAILNKREVAQDNYQSTICETNIQIEMEADKTIGLTQMLTQAATDFNTKIPVGGQETYINNVSYSYSPNNNTLNAAVAWRSNKTALRSPFPL